MGLSCRPSLWQLRAHRTKACSSVKPNQTARNLEFAIPDRASGPGSGDRIRSRASVARLRPTWGWLLGRSGPEISF